MPMLHGCGFPGCTTLTLSTYCVEHELLVRAVKESERGHGTAPLDLADDVAPHRAHADDEAQEPAPL